MVNERDITEKRVQIAREDEELMTIALYPTDIRKDKELYKCYNWLENTKNIIYGEGSEDKAIEIAQKMLMKNEDISYISEITGLSINEIEDLKNEEFKESVKEN